MPEIDPPSDWPKERIRAFRKHMEMKQADFGLWLGYGAGAQVKVSQLERGTGGVSGPMARLLDVLAEREGFGG